MSGTVASLRPEREPLFSLEAEKAVVSALMLDPARFSDVCAVVRGRHFFIDAHRRIFLAIESLNAEGKPTDIVHLAHWLRDQGRLDQVGGTPFLGQLLDETPAVANVVDHARIVADFARRRRIASDADNLANQARNGESLKSLSAAIGRLSDVSESSGPMLQRLDANAIFETLPPVEWVIRGLDLCPGAVAMWAGFGYSLKTLAAQSAAVAIATGQPVWGHFPAKQGRVLHLDWEQGSRLTRERYQRLATGMTVGPSDLQGQLELASMPRFHLDQVGAEEILCRELAGFSLVVIDSLRAAAPGMDENSSDARRVLDILTRASERTGCTALVIHHARKPSRDAQGGAKMAIRGSGALFDACSSVLIFDGRKGEPTRVSHEKARATGILSEDFELSVEDIEMGGQPRAGLLVSAELTTAPASQSGGMEERVIETVRSCPELTSASKIAERTRGRKADVLDAVKDLLRDGRLQRVKGAFVVPEEEKGNQA